MISRWPMLAGADLWQAMTAELSRREAGWSDAIDRAPDADGRWQLVEKMNRDMAQWHRIATVVASYAGIDRDAIRADLRGDIPALPATDADWLALLATARRTLDQAIERKDDSIVTNADPIWRRLWLHVHIWTLGGIAKETERTAA